MSATPGVHAKGTGSGAATATTAAVTTQASGSTFLVFAQSDTPHTGVTDNKGNTYTPLGSGVVTNSGLNSRPYVCVNGTGGAGHTWTFTGQTGDHSILACEITGALTSGAVDQVAGILDSASPYTNSTGSATSQADEISFSMLSGNSATTPATHAESTGYTILEEVTTGGPNWTCAMAYKSLSSIATESTSWTENGSSTGGVWIVTIKSASSATLEQEGFRWGEDDGSESAHTFTAAQDTSISAAVGSKLLRALINATLDPASEPYALYHQKNGSGGYTKVPIGASSSPVLSFGAIGTTAYSASGGTSVTPAYPTGITSNSCLVLVVGQKPTTANGGTVTTPSGWTLRDSRTGANDGDTGGYTTTLGADTGNCNIFVYTKDTVSGTESGTFSITVGDNGVCWATVLRVEASDRATFSYDSSTGKDTSAGNVSIATAAGIAIAAGDFILAGMVIPTDVTTPAQFSAEALSQTGTTFGTVTEIEEQDSTTGNDIGGFLVQAPVSSGSGSGAVTLTATAGGTTTNVRGPGFVLRIRAASVNNEVYISASSNIAAGGEATTARLTAPSGKSTSDFVTGRRWDDENGSDSIDITTDDYTEVEWRVTLAATLTNGDFIDFRVYHDVNTLNTYTVTPRWTVSGASTGDLNVTESPDTAAIAGDVLVEGSLDVTESADVANIAGDVLVRGSIAVTETADAAAIAGDVLVEGSFDVLETADTAVIAGDVLVEGSLDVSEAPDVAALTGNVNGGLTPIVGDLAATETADTAAIAGDVLVEGSLDATEAADAANFAGDVLVEGSLGALESGDAANIAGDILVRGSVVMTETADQADIAGVVPITGSLTVFESSDLTTISGVQVATGNLAVTESADTAAIAGDVLVEGLLAALESSDAAAIAGQIIVEGLLVATEPADVGNFAGDVLVEGSLAAIESPDICAVSQAPVIDGFLDAMESADVVAIVGLLEQCLELVLDPKNPDITNLIAVAFLDKFERFAKSDEEIAVVRLFYGDTYCQPYGDLTRAQYKALTSSIRQSIDFAPSAAGLVDTEGKSNA